MAAESWLPRAGIDAMNAGRIGGVGEPLALFHRRPCLMLGMLPTELENFVERNECTGVLANQPKSLREVGINRGRANAPSG